MNTKNVTIGALIVAVLIFAGLSFRTKDTVTTVIDNGNNVGAVASPEFMSDYISVGGLKTYSKHISLVTATTSVCSIRSPAATSTLRWTGFNLTTATSTATVLDLATSTTAFATTTSTTLLLPPITIASGALASISYTGTSTTAVTSAIRDVSSTITLPPSTWVNWKVGGFNPAGTSYFLGSCGAEFTVI